MAGASLLTLLDDIATVLDDVNAQQVSGVAAEREIPVVWAVAKGSFKNKCILVPAALLISAFIPWLIMPLLLLGGLFLCFEGAEKVLEKLFHSSHQTESSSAEPAIEDIEQYEKQKIAGAIRTDFILSAEIIVIALGTVQGQSTMTQVLVVSLIALVMTIGVYGRRCFWWAAALLCTTSLRFIIGLNLSS